MGGLVCDDVFVIPNYGKEVCPLYTIEAGDHYSVEYPIKGNISGPHGFRFAICLPQVAQI